jgi:drug/metabolite transporter (DMT)-like permease
MNPFTLLMLLFTLSGLVLIGISVPLIQRRIKPNYWYGFRTRRTLDNPQIWYDVNAHAGQRLLVSGLITTVVAAVLYFIPGLTLDGYALAMLFFAVVPLTIGLWQSFRYLEQLEE